MKIPQKIEKLLERREKLAFDLLDAESQLSDWLTKKEPIFLILIFATVLLVAA